jgi:hypothetical protein
MLNKLENLYLDILRVLTLGIATLALVAFVWGAFNSRAFVGPLFPQTPRHVAEDVATFGQFQSEEAQPSTSASENASTTTSATGLARAAEIVMQYIARTYCQGCSQSEIDLAELQLEQNLIEARDGIDPSHWSDYEQSLIAFLTALTSSDRSYEPNEINDAIAWHRSEFEAASADIQIDQAAEQASATLAASISGVSLALFIIVIFFFVLVKIERNLRVVRTRDADAP